MNVEIGIPPLTNHPWMVSFVQNPNAFVEENLTRIVCSSWEYDGNDTVGNTWTSQWNLVCDNEYLKNVAEMFFLLGVATGGIISGYLSDKFGRKTMLFISAILQTIFGMEARITPPSSTPLHH